MQTVAVVLAQTCAHTCMFTQEEGIFFLSPAMCAIMMTPKEITKNQKTFLEAAARPTQGEEVD